MAAAGGAAILASLVQIASGGIPVQWLILAGFAFVSGPFSIRIASLGAKLSPSERTIVNSDPALDLQDLINLREPRLRSCLSTPLVCEDTLVGVLSLYSTDTEAFTGEDARKVKPLAAAIARSLRNAGSFRPAASGAKLAA